MAIPTRTDQTGTFFVTSATYERRRLFDDPSNARLFIDTLQRYRSEGHFKLYGFVVMPDHVHLIVTPTNLSLERAMQRIKGSFSHALSSKLPAWQRGFTDHRIRDREDFNIRLAYLHHNPIRARLCQRPEDFEFSSAFRKPTSTAEAVPLTKQ